MHGIFTTLLLFVACSIVSSQENGPGDPYYIDVLIDADKNIYFEDTKVNLDEVSRMTSNKVEKLPFVPGKKLIYRIFGDRNLVLGDIIDVEQRMRAGFSRPDRSRRYLLETRQIPLDKSNWLEKLNKLDLKAIDQDG